MFLINLLSSGEAWQKLVKLLSFCFAVVLALTIHEYSHAKAAVKVGDNTPKMYGRLTLNPAKHFDIIGILAFIIAGFGWAKPIPVNPFNYHNYKKGNIIVSLAGVFSNLIIGVIASILFVISVMYFSGNVSYILQYFFYFIMLINFSLMIFNLIPIAPLDGFNLLNSFTKPNNAYMQFMRQYGTIILLVVLVTGVLGNVISFVLGHVVENLTYCWFWILGGA